MVSAYRRSTCLPAPPICRSDLNCPMTRCALTTAALAFSLLGACAPLWAAPATSAELEGSSANRSSPTQLIPGGLTPPAGAGIEQSKTVELLLQLQDQPNTMRDTSGSATRPESNRRAPASTTTRADEVAAPAASNPLLELKASLLGTGSGMASDSTDRSGAGDRPQASGLPPSSTSAQRPGARSAGDEAGSSLLAHPVIRFIRENRALAIGGSLGLLAAVWLAANYRGRAYRRR